MKNSKLRNFLYVYSTPILMLLSIILQIIIVGKYIDDSILNGYSPQAADAIDYSERAKNWRYFGFNSAFQDTYRMPGYPFLILIIDFISPLNTYLTVRIIQGVMLAISVGLLNAALSLYVRKEIAIVTSAFFLLLPLWHFVPILIAESFSAFVITLTLILLLRWKKQDSEIQIVVAVSILIAACVYLKPNQILILPIVLIIILFSDVKNKFKASIAVTSLVFLLLAPWLIFANLSQPKLNGLTATSGTNLYIGTGMVLSYDNGVLSKSALRWKVDPQNNPDDLISFKGNESEVEKNSIYTEKALEIWKKRPLRQLGYGIEKILIAFSFKVNSVFDSLLGILNIFTIFAAMSLTRNRELRGWGLASISCVVFLALQALAFQADRRFVVSIFTPFTVIIFALYFNKIYARDKHSSN